MRRTILVVDDDETLGQVLTRILIRDGYTVVQATSAAQAIQLAREQPPEVAVLDLCLPDGDGVHLAQQLRTRLGELPLILMTAYPLGLRDEPESGRIFAYILTKPLNLRELRVALKTTMRRGTASAPPSRVAG